MTDEKSFSIPNILIPPVMHNKGNFIISLGSLCKWLGNEAEKLGVEIYPGFAASDIIINNGVLKGIVTGDLGVDTKGTPVKIINLV